MIVPTQKCAQVIGDPTSDPDADEVSLSESTTTNIILEKSLSYNKKSYSLKPKYITNKDIMRFKKTKFGLYQLPLEDAIKKIILIRFNKKNYH